MDEKIRENLRKAIRGCNSEEAVQVVKRAIEERIDSNEVLDALTEAIREVGEGFRREELWLPELVGAAGALQAAMPFVEEEIKKKGTKRKTLGCIVIGAVYGDIHTIGKAIVSTLLSAGGFEVHDIGVDVKAEKFVEAVRSNEANILAMSALMSTTAPQQRTVIEHLKELGLREKVKVMVGGGAITEEFAKKIGADGYEPTAPGAVALAQKMIQ
jgi:5-methyltetrahydrofolate--homocysteine methyltransferase